MMLPVTYDGGRHAPLHERLMAAAVRRMKLLPPLCEISEPRPGVHRVACTETGSWIDYDTTGWRIRRIAEHDAEVRS